MCVVIDLDVVCLVCLHHSAEMHFIYNTCDEDTDIQIAQKISTLSKLKVDANNESLPDKICDSCLNDLNAAWRFHKNTQTAVAVFQSILKPLVSQQHRTPRNNEKRQETNQKQETAEKDDQQSQASASKDSFITVEQSARIQTPVVEDQDVGDLVEKEASNDEFLELDQCVVEEVHEDYQSVAETPDDDLALVEYYLADDSTLHEHPEETVNSTEDKITVKDVTENTTTIASKKIVVVNNTATQHAKVWPAVISKSAEPATSRKSPSRTRRRMHTQTLPKVVKPTIPVPANIRKSPKQVKRPTRFVHSQPEQRANTDESPEFSEHQPTDNEDEYERIARPVKSSRKRKSRSPDTKPPKICEICGNSYRFQHALNAHMRRHFQDKPFPCEMCDKAFVSNVELRRHMRVHTGHKPYACQYCDRRFSDFGSRIKHERTHTGERPYACNTCGKSFAYPHVLSVHLRTHTGEKKFRCDHCTKGFTKKAYLLSHLEQHHLGRISKAGVRDVTTYELTLEDDTGADNMEEGDDDLSAMKVVKFDDCIYTTEFVNESVVDHIDDGDEDVTSRDCEGNNTIILQESLLRPKHEANDDDDDEDVQEVEVHLDEYTIRVR